MAQATPPASGQHYGVRRVCQAWDVPRSSFYAARQPTPDSTLPRPPARPPTRRGPKSAVSDAALLAAIRQDLTLSPSTGEGHRKVWARLRAFQRSYDSGRTGVGSVLGPGWRHGFDLSAVPDSDGFEGMAATSPRNGIFSIAAIFVMLDLLNTSGSQPLDRLVISTLIAQFWMEQLTGNVFRISRPGAIETFVRTGTARWSEPAGSSSTLTVAQATPATSRQVTATCCS